MSSFEDLELPPALIEALAAEGIEMPTALQSHAIPVLRRGNSAVLRAAPGSGILVAYGLPLLERVEPELRQPGAIILTTDRDRADSLASSLARLAETSAHRVAALGGPWAVPELADILVGTPQDLERAVSAAQVKLDGVGSLVVDGASVLIAGDDPFARILPNLRDDLQIVVVSESITPAVRRFVEQRLKRGVFLPPEAMAPGEETSAVRRGTLRTRELAGAEEEAIASLVQELLEEGHDHVLLFFRSTDRAADVGDLLARRGFSAGAPGDTDLPVWLGVEALAAREDAGDLPFVSVSVDVPTDADELDRRHGRSEAGGAVVVRPRQSPHLRRIAQEAGYDLSPFPLPPTSTSDAAGVFRDRIRDALLAQDLVPHLSLLEPLFEVYSPVEVAAALSVLLRRREEEEAGEADGPPRGTPSSPEAGRFAWVRLFVSVGEKDGIGPGDLLGAIVGETGIPADRVGRIDLRDTFSRVEVDASVADRVIRALNGTSIRGRSMRVDYDRGETKSRHPGKAKAGKGRSGRGS